MNIVKPGDVILLKSSVILTAKQAMMIEKQFEFFQAQGFQFVLPDKHLDPFILRKENNVIPLTKGKSDV